MDRGEVMDVGPGGRRKCWLIGLASPAAFYGLIRLLPDGLRAGTGAIVAREIALIAFALLCVALLARSSTLSMKTLGMTRPRPGDLGWGLATALAAIILPAATALVLTRLGYHTRSAIVMAGLVDKPAWLIVTIAVGAAVSEEAVFRSVMIPALEFASGSLFVAVIASSAAFALMHLRYGVAKLPISFVSSLVFAGLFIRRRSLASCAAAHLVVDLTALIGVLVRGH